MSVADRYYMDAMGHLAQARDAMLALVGCTADLQSAVALESDFDELAYACAEFAACQFAIEMNVENN